MNEGARLASIYWLPSMYRQLVRKFVVDLSSGKEANEALYSNHWGPKVSTGVFEIELDVVLRVSETRVAAFTVLSRGVTILTWQMAKVDESL
jgi:hypothetical protein